MEKKDQIYYETLEHLLVGLADLDGLNLETVYASLAELCRLFRISKGVTTFYNSLAHEKANKGEIFVCYDDGRGGEAVMTRRVVTEAMTVATCSVYMAEGEEPLSELDRTRIDLIQKTILSFLSRNRLQRIVEKLTFYDDSGYRNLRYFFRYAEKLRAEGNFSRYAAIHFNLKHFSIVNQQIGRNAGNLVIHNYYQALSELIGEQGTVVRVGGDNFALICAKELVDGVLKILSGTDVIYDVNTDGRVRINACAGVFLIPEHFDLDDTSQIMDRILSASQAARTNGYQDVVFYNEDMVSSKEHMMRIQNMFPEALEQEEFKVFYQPKINVDGGDLVGAEALCRWFHEGLVIPPMEFIPVLEQGMDVCQLDFYMLDHVCKDIRRWLDEGKQVVRVSVNLSRKHMIDTDLLQHIIEIVDRNRVPHRFIEIELTETTTDVEFRDLKRVVNGLQQAGIYTSVDDFGMGYSSLNLIREIPWNVLKVDRSFLPVDEDNEKSTRSIMFRHVIAMAKEMGLECIAEGVETKSQVDVLKENQCDLAQGFYFDKPLPVQDFEERMAVHKYRVE